MSLYSPISISEKLLVDYFDDIEFLMLEFEGAYSRGDLMLKLVPKSIGWDGMIKDFMKNVALLHIRKSLFYLLH